MVERQCLKCKVILNPAGMVLGYVKLWYCPSCGLVYAYKLEPRQPAPAQGSKGYAGKAQQSKGGQYRA